MDYIILSTLVSVAILMLIFSYDISCQWSKNLERQTLQYPEIMQIDFQKTNVKAVIPRWHINAHGERCQTNFSFNYLTGAGEW
jgi:hypothetical protein